MHAGNAATLAMKAPAMKSRSNQTPADPVPYDRPAKTPYEEPPDEPPADDETEPEDDECDLDEPEAEDADDDRWDVFLLDDDGELIPERSDFWIPD